MKNNTQECMFIRIIKKVKLRTLLILIVLLVFNSYAWFIYSTKVATGLTAHVSAWNVEIKAGEGDSTKLEIDVDRIYPGMDKFEKIVEVKNAGEVRAKMSYEINAYKLLGVDYKTSVDPQVTQEDLKNQLLNEYPFKVKVDIPTEILEPQNGTGTFVITVEWPFESGDDALDTQWGEDAYEYYSLHPGMSSLHIDMTLSIQQYEG